LFDETIANPEYMSNPYVEDCVIKFTESIRIDCEWDMTDEEREQSQSVVVAAVIVGQLAMRKTK
jgi:hypothetical protein